IYILSPHDALPILFEGKAVAIRIAGQLRQGFLDRLERHRRRAEGVFVAGQLDDLGGIEAELPGQLFHRLAGYIGGQFLHAWQRQTEKIATHDKASSYKPQAPSNPLPNRVQLAAGSLPLRLKYRLRIG